MNDKASGVIKAVRKDGKGFQLDDGNWYSVFNPIQLKAAKGDYVEFVYKEAVKNGATYRNTQGVVQGTPTTITNTGSTREVPDGNTGSSQSRSPLMLPVMLARERAIIRQNALTNAVNLVGSLFNEEEKANVELVIGIAREFEAYTSGDYDIDTARKSLEEESVDGAS